MNRNDLKERTRAFSIRIVRLVDNLPHTISAKNIAEQLSRSGTSIGANYREACVGKSTADFIAKLSICQGEAEETLYWLEILMGSGLVTPSRLESLYDEAKQIASILAASVISARKNASRK